MHAPCSRRVAILAIYVYGLVDVIRTEGVSRAGSPSRPGSSCSCPPAAHWGGPVVPDRPPARIRRRPACLQHHPTAPDDDPDFLRNLERRRRQAEAERLRKLRDDAAPEKAGRRRLPPHGRHRRRQHGRHSGQPGSGSTSAGSPAAGEPDPRSQAPQARPTPKATPRPSCTPHSCRRLTQGRPANSRAAIYGKSADRTCFGEAVIAHWSSTAGLNCGQRNAGPPGPQNAPMPRPRQLPPRPAGSRSPSARPLLPG